VAGKKHRFTGTMTVYHILQKNKMSVQRELGLSIVLIQVKLGDKMGDW